MQAIGAEVHAVCDLNEAELEKAKSDLGARKAFTDFEQMLDEERLDAVLIGTPMQLDWGLQSNWIAAPLQLDLSPNPMGIGARIQLD